MRDSWKSLNIGEEINILSGFPFDSNHFNVEQKGKPLIRIRDILESTVETYFSGSYSEAFLIKEGDILVGMDGDFHVAKWKNRNALLNQRILKIGQKNRAEIDIEYFFYFLQPFLKKVHDVTAATTVKHLSTNDLKKAVRLFPPVEQQRKIAKILNTVDTVIEKTEAAIDKYKALKQGMMQDLFTRGIDLQTGKLRPSQQDSPELYKESALGWIPREWEVKRIDEIISERIRDFGSFSMTNLIDFVDYGVPFLKTEVIQDGFIKKENVSYITPKVHKLLNKSVVNEGDILFTKIGAIGRVAVYDGSLGECNSNAASAKIRIKNKYNKYFIAIKMGSDRIVKDFEKSIVSTPPRINLSDINSMPIELPPKKEQDLIGARIISLVNKLQIEEDTLGKYMKIKKGLMQDLLTGKVEVTI